MVGSLLITVGLLLSAGEGGRAQPTAPPESKRVLVDGSSTVAPITKAVAEEFKEIRPDVDVVVGISGTSGGFRRFCPGETDINDASRAIKKAEIEACAQNGVQYIELLIALDGITIAVDRETQIFQDEGICLTVGELELLWAREAEGVISHWNQVRRSFADKPITLSGAASTSGTYDFFTAAINRAEGDTRADYFATEEDQLLAEQISQDPFALAYFGFAFFVGNSDKVQAVAVDPRRTLIDAPEGVLEEINRIRSENSKPPLVNEGGECRGILPDLDTIGSFEYEPLSRPLYIYVNSQSGEREAVDAFVDFYLTDEMFANEEFLLDVGYIRLARPLREAVRACWEKRVLGTAFDGEFAGLELKEIAQGYQAHCGVE
jgi:phosphate transport system substrate-binding protein